MKKIIPICRCAHIAKFDDRKLNFVFEVSSHGLAYYLCADSEEIMERWMRVLQNWRNNNSDVCDLPSTIKA